MKAVQLCSARDGRPNGGGQATICHDDGCCDRMLAL